MYSVCRRHRGERVRHVNLTGARCEHERVRAMQITPTRLDLAQRQIALVGQLTGSRRAAQFDERRVGQIAKRKSR